MLHLLLEFRIILGVPFVNNPDLFKKEYYLYFWSQQGVAEGMEYPYKCYYEVEPGWNITEFAGKNIVSVKNLYGEVMFCVSKREDA